MRRLIRFLWYAEALDRWSNKSAPRVFSAKRQPCSARTPKSRLSTSILRPLLRISVADTLTPDAPGDLLRWDWAHPVVANSQKGTECAAICRYCFRKNLLHQGNAITATEMSKVREWMEVHPDVKSVVVTGGEPLILPTSRLNLILTTLQEVESVEHIRISAKICSFNPYRILDDPGLLKMFRERCQARLGNTIWIETTSPTRKNLPTHRVKR
jgi:4Fe-4S single cluster domain